MFHVYYIIFILVFHYVLLSSVAEMAALWTAALMLVVIVVLRTSSDDNAHSTVGRPTKSPSETYTETATTDYTGDVTSDGHVTKVAFVGNSGNNELRSNEDFNKLVKLFRAALKKLDTLRTDTGKKHGHERPHKSRKSSQWLVRATTNLSFRPRQMKHSYIQ